MNTYLSVTRQAGSKRNQSNAKELRPLVMWRGKRGVRPRRGQFSANFTGLRVRVWNDEKAGDRLVNRRIAI